jgi:hypothetical protein
MVIALKSRQSTRRAQHRRRQAFVFGLLDRRFERFLRLWRCSERVTAQPEVTSKNRVGTSRKKPRRHQPSGTVHRRSLRQTENHPPRLRLVRATQQVALPPNRRTSISCSAGFVQRKGYGFLGRAKDVVFDRYLLPSEALCIGWFRTDGRYSEAARAEGSVNR